MDATGSRSQQDQAVADRSETGQAGVSSSDIPILPQSRTAKRAEKQAAKQAAPGAKRRV